MPHALRIGEGTMTGAPFTGGAQPGPQAALSTLSIVYVRQPWRATVIRPPAGLFQDGRVRLRGLEPAVLPGLAGPAVLEPNDARGPRTKQP